MTTERATIYARPNNAHIRLSMFERGAFELHYGSWPAYTGNFTTTDSSVAFDFWPSGTPGWCAAAWCVKRLTTANLRGDTLFLRYDSLTAWLLCTDMMDFEVCDKSQSVYVRAQ